MPSLDLTSYGIDVDSVLRNANPARLYEEAIHRDPTAAIVDSGALTIRSGKKTGRSPADKRIVRHPDSEDDIWWGPINMESDKHTFEINRERAQDYLNTRAMVDAIHDGSLLEAPTETEPVFGLGVPAQCPGVPTGILRPRATWDAPEAYDEKARTLVGLFNDHFAQ